MVRVLPDAVLETLDPHLEFPPTLGSPLEPGNGTDDHKDQRNEDQDRNQTRDSLRRVGEQLESISSREHHVRLRSARTATKSAPGRYTTPQRPC
jgi:hypothetical protein